MPTTLKSWILLWVAALAMPTRADDLPRVTAALPELAAPPQGEAQWIARSMRMNGLPMTLKAFESRLTPQAVLTHYEWQLKSSGTREARRLTSPPWQVLMVRSREHFITVHARSVDRGSEGTILVSLALEPASLRVRTNFPTPPTARIANLQQYDDAGLQSEHIGLSSSRAPFTELQAFSQLLIRDGWSIVDTRLAHEINRGYVMEAQRRAEHALVVIAPDATQPSTTAIVIAWKK